MGIKVGIAYEAQNHEFAVGFVVGILRTATDWQDAQHAMSDHPTIGPWLRDVYGNGDIAKAQAIIREAEARLEDDLPY